MPFTPFHLGPGLLLKGGAPRGVSWSAFAVSQIVIDLEPLYYLMRGEAPLHRALHTLPGAALVGAVTVALCLAGRWALERRAGLGNRILALAERRSVLYGEITLSGVVWGATLGSFSHVLLDALLYDDVYLFWPWTRATPLLGMLSPAAVILGCVVTGALGLVWIGWRLIREQLSGGGRST